MNKLTTKRLIIDEPLQNGIQQNQHSYNMACGKTTTCKLTANASAMVHNTRIALQ